MRVNRIWGLAILGVFLWSSPAFGAGTQQKATAKEPDPMTVMHRMCDYLKSLQQFSFRSEVAYDEVYKGGKKLQYGAVMETYVKRPDMLRVNAVGDILDKTFFFNRRTITLYDKDKQVYATMQVPPTIESALDKASNDYGLRVSLTELANPRLWELISSKVETSLYVGMADVRGVPCHHLAFDSANVELQVWIDAGKKPLPLKVVFVEKNVEGEPQWSAYLSDWKIDPHLSDTLFKFTPPQGVQKIKFAPPTQQPAAPGSEKGNKS